MAEWCYWRLYADQPICLARWAEGYLPDCPHGTPEDASVQCGDYRPAPVVTICGGDLAETAARAGYGEG